MKPSIHAKQHQQSPHVQPGIRGTLLHESAFRQSRRGSQDLRRLNLIDPAYGGSPRSNKNSGSQSNRNSHSESPQNKPSKMDSVGSPKGSGSRSNAAVSQTPNKISFFGRAQAPNASIYKKSTFTNAAKEALGSPRSNNGGDSSRKDLNVSATPSRF